MATVKKSWFIETGWRMHRRMYRLTGGRVGRNYGGMPIVLLTTTGRKSGQPRPVTIPTFHEGDAWVAIASNAGEERDPDWVRNLRAAPSATVQVGKKVTPVIGRIADGEERDRLWARAVEVSPDYATYQLGMSRQIPVVVLEPTG